MKEALVGKDELELIDCMTELGQPSYRGKQLTKGIYQNFIRDINNLTNFSKQLREDLSKNYQISPNSILTKTESEDKTTKYLIKLEDNNTVECVNIFQPDHNTACLSTQVGCNIGCPFCATGLSGFERNLTTSEIVDQYLLMQKDSEAKISQIVFMGMGEPLLNYYEVMNALFILNNEVGIGMRHITLSTVGIIKQIEKLKNEKLQINLAISLHSAIEEKRNILVPISKTNPLDELLKACKEYANFTKRRITFEYVMLKGVNDNDEDAKILAKKLKGMLCHVNLIPHNPTSSEDYQASSMNRIKDFRTILDENNIPVTIRVSRGSSANSACGQLRVTKGSDF